MKGHSTINETVQCLKHHTHTASDPSTLKKVIFINGWPITLHQIDNKKKACNLFFLITFFINFCI